VVLLHGLCGSSLDLRGFARRIRQRGFHVVMPTLTGYGAPETELSLGFARPDYHRWIAEVTAEIDDLAEMHTDVYLSGVGLGATMALAVAAERPTKLEALALISTILIVDGWNVSRWRWLLPLAYYTPLGHFYRIRATAPFGIKNPRMRAWIAAMVERGTPASGEAVSIPTAYLLQADRLIRHAIDSLGRVRTPTLMIHAREDDVASIANVHFVRRQIGTDQFREVIVENSYSMITLDNDCDYAASRTVGFFNAIAKRNNESLGVNAQLGAQLGFSLLNAAGGQAL